MHFLQRGTSTAKVSRITALPTQILYILPKGLANCESSSLHFWSYEYRRPNVDAKAAASPVIASRSSYWEQSWSSSGQLLPTAVDILKCNHLLEGTYDRQPELKLLAKQKWETRVFLVFDISSSSYDPSQGHLPEQNKLPVAIFPLGDKVQAYTANPSAQNKVNRDVARAHNDNGINSLPPFATDYTCGSPFYPSPRDPSLFV
ncbi:uncharacterized protein APUU_31313S [Aspergillus puulaauensis]|uniref:Uncharacterized protein n=1 Tax=Aspergillus puulaauensis TaxID=1220207 RepID=A0A7R7XLI7_9EURO|nr:uncharacterized protein APUU_31313S [Aspergillus puulaauensis]BCS23088.1 hypothetical protein APUU_31313S [Aspergillus puulaauensis]